MTPQSLDYHAAPGRFTAVGDPRRPASRVGARCHAFSRLTMTFLRSAGVPGRFGLSAIDEHGAHWIAHNLRLDLASLNKVEMLPWDVWGRFGPYEERQELIVDALSQHQVDVLVLQESWAMADGSTQAQILADRLGLEHWFVGEPGLDHGDWSTTSAIVTRWPIVESEHLHLSAPAATKGSLWSSAATSTPGPTRQSFAP